MQDTANKTPLSSTDSSVKKLTLHDVRTILGPEYQISPSPVLDNKTITDLRKKVSAYEDIPVSENSEISFYISYVLKNWAAQLNEFAHTSFSFIDQSLSLPKLPRINYQTKEGFTALETIKDIMIFKLFSAEYLLSETLVKFQDGKPVKTELQIAPSMYFTTWNYDYTYIDALMDHDYLGPQDLELIMEMFMLYANHDYAQNQHHLLIGEREKNARDNEQKILGQINAEKSSQHKLDYVNILARAMRTNSFFHEDKADAYTIQFNNIIMKKFFGYEYNEFEDNLKEIAFSNPEIDFKETIQLITYLINYNIVTPMLQTQQVDIVDAKDIVTQTLGTLEFSPKAKNFIETLTKYYLENVWKTANKNYPSWKLSPEEKVFIDGYIAANMECGKKAYYFNYIDRIAEKEEIFSDTIEKAKIYLAATNGK